MSCCGGKRIEISLTSQRTPVRFGAPRSGIGALDAEFEYSGGGALTVIGQGTGRTYRFVGYGSRLSVDWRDRASLSAAPSLRPVGSR